MNRNERSEGFILLHLLLGRAGSGKTTYLRNLLKETPVTRQPILLVPEQGSFQNERAMLRLWDQKMHNVFGCSVFLDWRIGRFAHMEVWRAGVWMTVDAVSL